MQISTKATKFCSSVCLSVLALYLKRILLGRKKIAFVWLCRTKTLPDEFNFCDVRQILTVKFSEMHQTSRTVVKTFSVSWIWPLKIAQGEFQSVIHYRPFNWDPPKWDPSREYIYLFMCNSFWERILNWKSELKAWIVTSYFIINFKHIISVGVHAIARIFSLIEAPIFESLFCMAFKSGWKSDSKTSTYHQGKNPGFRKGYNF